MKENEMLTVHTDENGELVFNYAGSKEQFFKVVEAMLEGMLYTLSKNNNKEAAEKFVVYNTLDALSMAFAKARRKLENEPS